MAQQIIVKGKVFSGYSMCFIDDGKQYWDIGRWAEPYDGQTLVISLEEEELEPAINERLKKVLVEA